MSRRRVSIAAALVVAGLVTGCGGSGATGDGSSAVFPVSITSSFPTSQTLAQESSFTVRVTNTGHRALPNVAVTVLNPRYGTAAQAFGTLIAANAPGQPILASRSRPVWIINQAPGPCGYSCRNRGPGAAATAYSNTWALGRLAPGRTVTFRWKLTAVQAGSFRVVYEVAPSLGGGRAELRGGAPARGSHAVNISSAAPQVTVSSGGQVSQSS